MAKLGERRAILLLCYINFLNRGIIPGAPESFQIFITKSLGVSVTRQNFYMGLLSSVYVAATALFSLVFGYLALSRKPFQLITGGMLVWVLSAVVSALAYYADSYYLLALGRVLSGAGEASFQCNAMPFINRHAPKQNGTLWLGVFISSTTIGAAVGYIYGAAFAESSLTWASAFFVEAVLMAPAILLSASSVDDELNVVPVEVTGDLSGALIQDSEPAKTTVDKAFAHQWWRVLTNIPFTLIALGYAAYTFTLGCFSTFSPTLLIGLGFFKTESDVSFMFGAVVLHGRRDPRWTAARPPHVVKLDLSGATVQGRRRRALQAHGRKHSKRRGHAVLHKFEDRLLRVALRHLLFHGRAIASRDGRCHGTFPRVTTGHGYRR